MQRRILMSCCLAIILASAVPVFAASNADSTIVRPRTPEAAQVISQLEQARLSDRMNSQSYMGGENSEAGLFYYRKGQEVDALLKRLRAGHAVSTETIKSALDDSKAVRYGG